jgi:hypothetical protein
MRKTIEKQCLTCNKTFTAALSEHNRGNAKYCSISCGKQGKSYTKTVNCTCVYCGNNFLAGSKDAKYCSKICKQKNYRKQQVTLNFGTKALQNTLNYLPCEIPGCGWKEATRDIHHLVSVAKGGKNTLDNVIAVCPNHHRMFHHNLISEETVKTAFKLRLYHHPELYTQEQDARAGN